MAWHIYPEDNSLQWRAAAPLPCPAEYVRLRVACAGVNRADILQRQGKYPMPESGVMGLEVAGMITEKGKDVQGWQVGQRVCALLAEGGYAEEVLADARLLLPVPDTMPDAIAAALPEALATSQMALWDKAGLCAGEVVLIHGSSSGVGSIAVQMARLAGARVIATAGNAEKCAFVRSLGAEVISYQQVGAAALPEVIQDMTQGQGVDVVLDMLGGEYLPAHLQCLRYGGRMVSIAFLHGAKAEVNMAQILMKNLSWVGMTLRSQPAEVKADIMRRVCAEWWGHCMEGRIQPHIHKVFPMAEVKQAHQVMQRREHLGKIVLTLVE